MSSGKSGMLQSPESDHRTTTAGYERSATKQSHNSRLSSTETKHKQNPKRHHHLPLIESRSPEGKRNATSHRRKSAVRTFKKRRALMQDPKAKRVSTMKPIFSPVRLKHHRIDETESIGKMIPRISATNSRQTDWPLPDMNDLKYRLADEMCEGGDQSDESSSLDLGFMSLGDMNKISNVHMPTLYHLVYSNSPSLRRSPFGNLLPKNEDEGVNRPQTAPSQTTRMRSTTETCFNLLYEKLSKDKWKELTTRLNNLRSRRPHSSPLRDARQSAPADVYQRLYSLGNALAPSTQRGTDTDPISLPRLYRGGVSPLRDHPAIRSSAMSQYAKLTIEEYQTTPAQSLSSSKKRTLPKSLSRKALDLGKSFKRALVAAAKAAPFYEAREDSTDGGSSCSSERSVHSVNECDDIFLDLCSPKIQDEKPIAADEMVPDSIRKYLTASGRRKCYTIRAAAKAKTATMKALDMEHLNIDHEENKKSNNKDSAVLSALNKKSAEHNVTLVDSDTHLLNRATSATKGEKEPEGSVAQGSPQRAVTALLPHKTSNKLITARWRHSSYASKMSKLDKHRADLLHQTMSSKDLLENTSAGLSHSVSAKSEIEFNKTQRQQLAHVNEKVDLLSKPVSLKAGFQLSTFPVWLGSRPDFSSISAQTGHDPEKAFHHRRHSESSDSANSRSSSTPHEYQASIPFIPAQSTNIKIDCFDPCPHLPASDSLFQWRKLLHLVHPDTPSTNYNLLWDSLVRPARLRSTTQIGIVAAVLQYLPFVSSFALTSAQLRALTTAVFPIELKAGEKIIAVSNSESREGSWLLNLKASCVFVLHGKVSMQGTGKPSVFCPRGSVFGALSQNEMTDPFFDCRSFGPADDFPKETETMDTADLLKCVKARHFHFVLSSSAMQGMRVDIPRFFAQLKKIVNGVISNRVELLYRVPLFEGMERGKLLKLAAACNPKEYGPNQQVKSQGDCVDELFIVVSGSLNLYHKLHFWGRNIQPAQISKGKVSQESPLPNHNTQTKYADETMNSTLCTISSYSMTDENTISCKEEEDSQPNPFPTDEDKPMTSMSTREIQNFKTMFNSDSRVGKAFPGAVYGMNILLSAKIHPFGVTASGRPSQGFVSSDDEEINELAGKTLSYGGARVLALPSSYFMEDSEQHKHFIDEQEKVATGQFMTDPLAKLTALLFNPITAWILLKSHRKKRDDAIDKWRKAVKSASRRELGISSASTIYNISKPTASIESAVETLYKCVRAGIENLKMDMTLVHAINELPQSNLNLPSEMVWNVSMKPHTLKQLSKGPTPGFDTVSKVLATISAEKQKQREKALWRLRESRPKDPRVLTLEEKMADCNDHRRSDNKQDAAIESSLFANELSSGGFGIFFGLPFNQTATWRHQPATAALDIISMRCQRQALRHSLPPTWYDLHVSLHCATTRLSLDESKRRSEKDTMIRKTKTPT